MPSSNVRFSDIGLVSITSLSIVRDCARLLVDLYFTGIQLSLLSANSQSERMMGVSLSLLESDETAQQGLVMLSDLVAAEIYCCSHLNRLNVASLYDLAKHLQSFHSLLANKDVQARLREVLKTDGLMMHKDSVGMRIDLPNEIGQLTELHQEFHSFPFGINAAVLWVPLTRISRFHGTLAYYPLPHLSEPFPFDGDPAEQSRLLAKGRMQEAQKIGGLQVSEEDLGAIQYLEAEPGQCYIFSASLPHSSLLADPTAEFARLTCQARFFDTRDPFMAWKHGKGIMWEGLKNPSDAWKFWQEYSCG